MQEVKSVLSKAIRIAESRNGKEVGHVSVIFIFNDSHTEGPYAFIEDLSVDPQWRGQGVARLLMKEVFKQAKDHRCYKLIATSRSDGTRDDVHAWYVRLGLRVYGIEFRMDF